MNDKISDVKIKNHSKANIVEGGMNIEVLKIPYNVVRSGKKEDALKGIFKTQFENQMWSDH